jgi:hypothetical protein
MIVRIMGVMVFIYNLIYAIADIVRIFIKKEGSYVIAIDKIMILMTMFIAIVVTFK